MKQPEIPYINAGYYAETYHRERFLKKIKAAKTRQDIDQAISEHIKYMPLSLRPALRQTVAERIAQIKTLRRS